MGWGVYNLSRLITFVAKIEIKAGPAVVSDSVYELFITASANVANGDTKRGLQERRLPME